MKIIVHRAVIMGMFLPQGEIGRKAAKGAGRVRDRAKRKATVDTGLMRNSIIAELSKQGLTSVTWRIGSNLKYALYQELGTGPIYARRAPLLVFRVNGRWVSTYSTKGVPAVRMLTKAVEQVSVRDFL